MSRSLPKSDLIMLDEARIQLTLYADLINRGQKIVVPNISWSWLYWEADLISVTKANYVNEFEIKISKQDFEKDFGKRKHEFFQRPNKYMNMPNYFWYVAPIEAIPICVPDYAGLIEVWEDKKQKWIWMEEIRRPKKLHKKKISDNDIHKILRSLMFKYWDLSRKLDQRKRQKDLFN